MAMVLSGWRTILRLLWSLVARLFGWLTEIWGRARRGKERPRRRDYRDACCIILPPKIRARPDPYVYSQQWLRSRGIAVTWDNPDFRLIDVTTGAVVPRVGLQANRDYDIEVTIHNSSFMAAIHTNVSFEVRQFGAGTSVARARNSSDAGKNELDKEGRSLCREP
jgi:hypothetical protein